MWTEVSNGKLVDHTIAKVGGELNIQPKRGPSLPMLLNMGIGKGEWFYTHHGLDTRVMRWGMGANRLVKGPEWTESEDSYRERLERELRAAVSELQDPFFDER